MDKYVKQYMDKWQQWIKEHNIDEDDEMANTWCWQFDNDCNFIDSPEILLGCYVAGYGREDAKIYLEEHFTQDMALYEMAQIALEMWE